MLKTWDTTDIDSDAFYYDIDTTEEINQLRATNPVDHAMNIYPSVALQQRFRGAQAAERNRLMSS